MKYTPTTEFRGGWLLGYLEPTVRYEVLEKLFGPPGEGDQYKVAFEWTIDFEDGLFACIYDWKETSLYDEDLVQPFAIKWGYYIPKWHIGGEDKRVVERVNKLIAEATAQ